MMRTLRYGVLLTCLFAAATAVLGWWAIPIIAAAWGALRAQYRGSALIAGVAAMFGWGLLLGFAAMHGPVERLAETLSALMQMRPMGIYGMTLAFPGLLAVTAAVVGRALHRSI